MIGVLRLMLRTQPPSGNWLAPVFASRKIVGARLWSQTQPQSVGDDWRAAADALHTAARRQLAGNGVRVAGKSLERGCGRRPSRSALEMIGVLRLMLRTQPRAEKWPGGSCTRVDACFSPPPLKSAGEAA